jgi:Raf kinase inhibitor-like YbhB/YbcL family protein
MRFILALTLFLAATSLSAEEFSLKVKAFDDKNQVKAENAFCVGSGEKAGHGKNISPAVSWSNAPKETQSFVLIMHDPDVPTDFSKANKKDAEIDDNQPRQVFYHWVLADIPAKTKALKEGAEGKGVKLNRLKPGKAKIGTRGLNDYTKFMKDDKKMAGNYAGYDGPCPPWNDARPHRYIFTLYALKVKSLNLPKNFTGADVVAALPGKVLAQTKVEGRYSLNPRLVQ